MDPFGEEKFVHLVPLNLRRPSLFAKKISFCSD
jgi:hypothetical protein